MPESNVENGSYRYVLEMMSGEQALLEQVPVRPDWVPALECVTFDAIRRGRLPAELGGRPGIVEPVWDGSRGRPYVASFRASLPAADDGVHGDLPISYLGGLAREASSDLVRRGLLQTGETFRYRVCAFPESTLPRVDDGLHVSEEPYPLPLSAGSLTELVASSVRHGESAAADDFPVFVSRDVLADAAAQARESPEVETGGVLVGRLHRDPDQGEIFLVVNAYIRAQHALSHATQVTFTPETWASVDAAIDLRRQDEIPAGWNHVHIDWCRNCPVERRRECRLADPFFSAADVHFHRVCFNRPYHVALLITDNSVRGMSWSMFGWRNGIVTARGFHILEERPGS